MTQNQTKRNGKIAAALALSVGVLSSGLAPFTWNAGAQTIPFADPAFRRAWERADLPVAQGQANRTWLWGPSPGAWLREPFKEGPGGQHLVQYFDKARMEVNYSTPNFSDPNYVTNGLLVVEMISGRIQTSVNDFKDFGASDVQIAGDEDSDAPTYSALRDVASVGVALESKAPALAPGTVIPAVYINRGGTPYASPPPGENLASLPAIRAAAYFEQTGHNVANVFVTYMNSQGQIYENGAYRNGLVVNWAKDVGYPVTEPYWTSIRVGGQNRLVLFQAFQRRVLTYSPGNPDGWKVEMGNVGAQYYGWRYNSPATLTCDRVPVRGFGRVWADHRGVQNAVGCPYDAEEAVQTAYEPFEHGTMLWISRNTYIHQQFIYVFFNDGSLQQFDDTWTEDQPANAGLTPPPGLYEPQRGFGKVWREGTGARVRERLGWATALEKGGPGAYQLFQHGEMYWTGAANKIYVLYGHDVPIGNPGPNPMPATPGPAGTLYRYDVFNDTYGP